MIMRLNFYNFVFKGFTNIDDRERTRKELIEKINQVGELFYMSLNGRWDITWEIANDAYCYQGFLSG